MRDMVRVAVVGFGNLGRAFVRVAAMKRKSIEKKYGVLLDVVAVVDSKGMALKSDGFTDYELLKLSEVPRSGVNMFSPYAVDFVDLEYMYNKVQPDIHIELTSANYVTGEPALQNVMFAIGRGVHVITANKAPLVLKFKEVMDLAKQKSVYVKFRPAVMGGTPLIDTLMSMKSEDVEQIEGILNATANFILTEMHEKLIDFDEALKRAQALGIVEANPLLDIEGIDAAAKLVVISNVIGYNLTLDKVERESVSKVSLRDIIEAIKQGYVIKYLASLDTRSGKASVKVVKIHKSNIFAQIDGILNAVRVKSDVGGLFFVGKGGGGIETAHSIIDDIIDIVSRIEGERR